MLELKNLGVHKIYLINVHSVLKTDINRCFFFFYYKTDEGDYIFKVTRGFPLYWKKQLSKKLIDNLLSLKYSYWFSTDREFDRRVENKFLKERVLEHLYYPSPLNINIRGYNV